MARKKSQDEIDDATARTLPLPEPGGLPAFKGFGDMLMASASSTGHRTWLMRYYSPTRRAASGKRQRRDWKLGTIGVMTITEARAKRDGAKRLIEIEGKDPQDEGSRVAGRAKRDTPFKTVAAEALEFHKPQWKTLMVRGKLQCRQHDAWASNFKRYINPIIGNLTCDAVDVDAVLKVLKQKVDGVEFWTRHNQSADLSRSQIEYVLDYAADKEHGYRDPELRNPADMATLKFQLNASKFVRPTAVPFAALTADQIPALIAKLAKRRGVLPLCVTAIFLTTKREKAIATARWPDIDRAEGVWRIPGELMKTRHKSKVEQQLVRAGGWREPITGPLGDILDVLWPLRASDDGYIFFGRPKNTHINMSGLSLLLHRLGIAETVHGSSRAGFKEWSKNNVAESEGFSAYDLAELCMGHEIRTAVQKSYDRDADGLRARTKPMVDWAAFCMSAMPRDNVVQMSDAAD